MRKLILLVNESPYHNSEHVSRASSVYNVGPFSCILGCTENVHIAEGTQAKVLPTLGHTFHIWKSTYKLIKEWGTPADEILQVWAGKMSTSFHKMISLAW